MTTPRFKPALPNPFGLSDVGFWNSPTFVDIDGDGDLDALIGNEAGNTLFFRNTGTVSSPSFAQEGGTNPFGLSDVGRLARPFFADIDGDGDLDAFISEIDGNTVFFRNTGTVSSPTFVLEGTNLFGLSNVGVVSHPTFADIDSDGDLDAFIGNQVGNTLFFRNTGTASSPSFTQEGTNPFGLSDVGANSSPTFADIDNDGDLDAFIGNLAGNTLFFRNTGTASSPSFAQESTNPLGLSDVGTNSSPTFADIDSDGDLDAFIGNFDGNTLFFENAFQVSIAPGTTPSEAGPTAINGTFVVTLNNPAPVGGLTITYTVGGTATSGVDYSALPGTLFIPQGETQATITVTPILDGVVDPGETVQVTLTSTPDAPYFVGPQSTVVLRIADQVPLGLAAPVVNPFGLSNVGSSSSPTLVDIDGDGDLDAFIGNQAGNTLFFRNTGTASSPTFAQESTNPFGLSNVVFMSRPSFADIDGDGDLDAFIGNEAGNTVFFRNTGTASSPSFSQESTNPFGLSDVGEFSSPTFADIDGDGDLDAFIGNFDSNTAAGNTVFFRNTGTASSPSFVQESTNPFGLSSVGRYSSPTLADVDGDGDFDALIGNLDGNTVFFRNTGTASSPSFSQGSTNPFGLSNVGYLNRPTFADIDGDGDLDALVGNSDGNTLFFENAPTITVAAAGNLSESPSFSAFFFTLSQSAPDGGITISYVLSGTTTNGVDYSIAPTTTTIPAGATTRNAFVLPIDDALIEGTETITLTIIDAQGYNLGANTSATINLLDNDAAGFTLSKTTATVSESGTTDSISVVLSARPTSNVVLSLTASDATETSTNPTTLTFTPDNWNLAQSITITGIDDALIDGSQLSNITVSVVDASSDDAFDGLADQVVSITTLDNDAAGFTLSKTAVTVSESGTTDSFTVALTAQPTSDVVLSVTSSDSTEASASPTLLTFTSANWNLAQSVTITGIDDLLDDGDQLSAVNISVVDASSDDAFDNLFDQSVAITTLDDDVTLNGTSGRDKLTGSSANEIITGFAGADKITTGGGRDLVVYTSIRDTGDTITDFSVGNDKIVLAALLDSLVAGGYNGTNAIADGYVRVVSRGVNTVVQIDNDGFGTRAIARDFLTLQSVAIADASNPNNFVFN